MTSTKRSASAASARRNCKDIGPLTGTLLERFAPSWVRILATLSVEIESKARLEQATPSGRSVCEACSVCAVCSVCPKRSRTRAKQAINSAGNRHSRRHVDRWQSGQAAARSDDRDSRKPDREHFGRRKREDTGRCQRSRSLAADR